jgi:aminomethyltransferase
VPSDLGKVAPMTGQYTVLTNERGGVVDDIILYELARLTSTSMVFNAANRQKDLDWFHRWRRASGAWGCRLTTRRNRP